MKYATETVMEEQKSPNMQFWQFELLIERMIQTNNIPKPLKNELIHLKYNNAKLSLTNETLQLAIKRERKAQQAKINKLIIKKACTSNVDITENILPGKYRRQGKTPKININRYTETKSLTPKQKTKPYNGQYSSRK